MTTSRPDGDAERYRNAYLKLRGALHDPNTGLPAYPVLVDELRRLLDGRRHVGVVHVEAANVDLVESLYGWQAFDRVLARMAETLRASLGSDVPASALLAVDAVPGERFVVFVPDAPDGRAPDATWLERVASLLRARVEEAFDADDDLATLSPRPVFRAGHALLTDNPFYRFERRVHAAVEEARTLPRRRESRRERVWRAELMRIIRDESISVLFQPVVDLGSREVMGYEALTRGPKDSVFEMPRAMFSLSGRLGAAADLDRLCRSAALRASGPAAGRGKLFLNVWPGCLADPDWRGGVADALAASAREPGDVVLEVSERALGDDLTTVGRACESLRAAGFRLAVDGVGTGYASFLALDAVHPDFLKADPALVRGVHENLIRQELLASIVAYGARIGAHVVAVGVENEDEVAALRAAGAELGQGFLFAGPAPLGTWIAAGTTGH